MGKKRSQNEVAQKLTIQKLVGQRDEALRQLNEVLDGRFMLKSDHEAIIREEEHAHETSESELHLKLKEANDRIALLERDAQNGNRLVYSELNAAREHIDLLNDALKAKNAAYGEQVTLNEQLRAAMDANEKKYTDLEKLAAALEKQLTNESAEAARQTRKRLEKKTAFISEQQTYINHLERTLRLLSSLPSVQSYLRQLKEAKEAGTLEVTRIGSAVLEAETIETKRPVEVIVHGQVAP